MPTPYRPALAPQISELIVLEGYSPRAVSKILGENPVNFTRELEEVLRRKVVSKEEADEFRRRLELLIRSAHENRLYLLEGFFRSRLEELSQKEVGEEITIGEYTKLKSLYSRRKAFRKFTNWAKERFRKVALLACEIPLTEELSKELGEFGFNSL
jgi:hypothetical protein